MFQFKWAGVAAVLVAALGLGRAAADDVYDLRGPAPQKGQVFVNKGSLKIKDADAVMKVAGQEVKLKLTMHATSEEEAKVLATDGRNVTKCQTKIIKERAEVSGNLGGMDLPATTEPTKLEKETVISERDGKGWKHSLVDNKPTDKQKKELDSRNGIENDDELYPAEKVKVGHTWTVEAAALAKMLGNSFSDLKGKLSQKFVKIEKVDGEDCAVVESVGKISGKMKDDGEPTIDVEMEIKVLTYKSLATGVNMKETFEGKIKLDGTTKMDDIAVDIKLVGPMIGESTTRLKK